MKTESETSPSVLLHNGGALFPAVSQEKAHVRSKALQWPEAVKGGEQRVETSRCFGSRINAHIQYSRYRPCPCLYKHCMKYAG